MKEEIKKVKLNCPYCNEILVGRPDQIEVVGNVIYEGLCPYCGKLISIEYGGD